MIIFVTYGHERYRYSLVGRTSTQNSRESQGEVVCGAVLANARLA